MSYKKIKPCLFQLLFYVIVAIPKLSFGAQYTLCVTNETEHPVVSIVSHVDNYDWEGMDRPDHNFNHIDVNTNQKYCTTEDKNSWASLAQFNLDFKEIDTGMDLGNARIVLGNAAVVHSPHLNGEPYNMMLTVGDPHCATNIVEIKNQIDHYSSITPNNKLYLKLQSISENDSSINASHICSTHCEITPAGDELTCQWQLNNWGNTLVVI